MGEQQNQSFQLSFNPSLKVDFQGPRLTSDGGLLLVSAPEEKSFHGVANRRDGCTMVPFFEAKKEIPDKSNE